MKGNIFLISFLFLIGCNSTEKNTQFFEDYSLINSVGINKIQNAKSNRFFVEVKKLHNEQIIIAHLGPTDSAIVSIDENSKFKVIKIIQTDKLYSEIPKFLILNKGTNNVVTYSFLDNTITVDSLINCIKTEFNLEYSKQQSGEIKQRDTVNFMSKILSGDTIRFSIMNSSRTGKDKFKGRLMENLSLIK